MDSREKIISTLKNFNAYNENKNITEANRDKKIFKDYPSSEQKIEQFKNNFERLCGEFYSVHNIEEVAVILNSIISKSDLKKGLYHPDQIFKKVFDFDKHLLDFFYKLPQALLDSNQFVSYDVGLTTARYLVARTGSIVIDSFSNGGRRLSVLPPVHIVVAKNNQIVFSLEDIFNEQFINVDWSFASIVSGPSRTSDIEKQLVLGAHGPKRLIVILVNNLE